MERSEIVANSRMNRERRAIGVNSYEKDLGLNPIEFLSSRVQAKGHASWLDLCCGRGLALMEAAEWFLSCGKAQSVSLRGVDLVDSFESVDSRIDFLQFDVSALHRWDTAESFDLITCVHGLHYIGDKLSAIDRATAWLAADGTFIAHLDLANLIDVEGRPLAKHVLRRFRDCDYEFNPRKHVLSRTGIPAMKLGFQFIGADDTAGPNFTRQDAVNSDYRMP